MDIAMATTIAKIPTVLLVDDDDVVSMCLRRGFKREKIPVHLHTSVDGLDALQYLMRCAPRELPVAIVLELTMPQMDGITFLRHIRTVETLVDLDVYILTGSNNPSDRRVAEALGVIGYISKPEGPADYQNVVRALSGVWARLDAEQIHAATAN